MSIITIIMVAVKGATKMIVFDPFWRTMKNRGYTTYTLRVKFGIGSDTVLRLQKNKPVSTYTLNRLCKLLDCTLPEIAEYIPDREEDAREKG